MARIPHPIKAHPALTYQEPLMVRIGRYAMTGTLVLLVLSGLYVAVWFLTAMNLRSGIEDWAKARQSEGYLAQYDDQKARISGFPFNVKAQLSDVAFAPPVEKNGKRPWVWSAQKIAFKIVPLPWSIGELHVDLSHHQKFSINAARFEGKAKKFELLLDWTSKGLPDDFSVEINNLDLENKNNSYRFFIDHLMALTNRQNDGAYGFDVNGEGLNLPVGISGLGRKVDDIILRGQLSDGFGQTGLSKDTLMGWRDNGGTMEVERLQLKYDPLMIQGNGTLALDGDMQLVGAFSARIQGFFETVEQLHRGGVVRGPDATMAKVVLGMLAKHPDTGGPPSISLPLTIQDGTFFAGPVRLLEMPKINW